MSLLLTSTRRKPIQISRLLPGYLLALLLASSSASAFTLWSVDDSELGAGYFYGPGSYPIPSPMMPLMIRNVAFTSDRDFVVPYWNNGGEAPNSAAELDFPPLDGRLSDGTPINENFDFGTFVLAGTRFMPAVGEGGALSGQSLSVTMADGNIVMIFELTLDLGIGTRGIIRMPLYATTSSLTVPEPLEQAAYAPRRAGPFKSGESLSGRVGDFNNDGFIDGIIVAVGVMPIDSPIYPGQPWALEKRFETDVPIAGATWGSPQRVNKAYGYDADYRAVEMK